METKTMKEIEKEFGDLVYDVIVNIKEVDGKPAYKGYKYVSMGNLLRHVFWQWIAELIEKEKGELQWNYNRVVRKLEKLMKKTGTGTVTATASRKT